MNLKMMIWENKFKILVCFLAWLVVSPILSFFIWQHINLVILYPAQFSPIPFPGITMVVLVFLSIPFAGAIIPFFLWDLYKGSPKCIPKDNSGTVPTCTQEGTPAFPGKKDKIARDFQNQPRYPVG